MKEANPGRVLHNPGDLTGMNISEEPICGHVFVPILAITKSPLGKSRVGT